MFEEKKDSYIQDKSSLHDFRTEIPNIVFSLGLDPYEKALYLEYKRVAGDKGACWKSNKSLAEAVGCSIRKIQSTKKKLCKKRSKLNGKSLITVVQRKREDKGDASDIITIMDIWENNAMEFIASRRKKEAPKRATPHAPDAPPPMHIVHPPHAPGAPKEDPYKEDPIEERMSQLAEASCRLATLLLTFILKLNPKAKKPNLDTWANDIDKLIRLDGRSEEEIEKVIRWSLSDDFWCKNILSGRKLREKFDQLFVAMQTQKKDPKKQKAVEAKTKADRALKNMEWAKNFLKEGPVNIGDNFIRLRDNGVEVKLNTGYHIIGLLEHGFSEQVKNAHMKITR
jgi:hypothetical protein